jgi:hypothetical protein
VPVERKLVARDSKQGVLVVVVLVVTVLLGIAVLGILAAISIPALVRARMAGNEAVAIGALRAMTSAQAAYAASHGGEYGQRSFCVTDAGTVLEYLTKDVFAPSDADEGCPAEGRTM